MSQGSNQTLSCTQVVAWETFRACKMNQSKQIMMLPKCEYILFFKMLKQCIGVYQLEFVVLGMSFVNLYLLHRC